jgi:hypothetical protein
MVRSKATWKWFVARCMKSSVPYRMGLDFRTLRVCPATVADWRAAHGRCSGCLCASDGGAAGAQLCLAPARATAELSGNHAGLPDSLMDEAPGHDDDAPAAGGDLELLTSRYYCRPAHTLVHQRVWEG